jgi:hypothetical protein
MMSTNNCTCGSQAPPEMITSFLQNKGLTSAEVQVALEVAAKLRSLPLDGPEGGSASRSPHKKGLETL